MGGQTKNAEYYEYGYNDGLNGSRKDIYMDGDTDYDLGYVDGSGDREMKEAAASHRAVDDEAILGDAPSGFAWSGEKRTPNPGDYYLTKAGGVKLSSTVRKNAQQRHILTPLAQCNCTLGTGWGRKSLCPLHAKVSL